MNSKTDSHCRMEMDRPDTMEEIYDVQRQLREDTLTTMERLLLEQTLRYLTRDLVDVGDGCFMSAEELEEQKRWEYRDQEGWSWDEGFDLADEI